MAVNSWASFIALLAASNSALYFLAKASLLSRMAIWALMRSLVSSSLAALRAVINPMRSRSNLSLSLSISVRALLDAVKIASSSLRALVVLLVRFMAERDWKD